MIKERNKLQNQKEEKAVLQSSQIQMIQKRSRKRIMIRRLRKAVRVHILKRDDKAVATVARVKVKQNNQSRKYMI
jgi:hypothetical protein